MGGRNEPASGAQRKRLAAHLVRMSGVVNPSGSDRSARADLPDRLAFEVILAPLIDPAYRIAFALLRDRGQAEDAVQEACFKAWWHFEQLRDREHGARPWFFKIVGNECRMQQRSRWRKILRLPLGLLAQEGSSEEERANRADLKAVVGRLPRRERLLLFLYFCLDLPFEEIGPIVGVSPTAAKARLYRITRRLRPELAMQEALL